MCFATLAAPTGEVAERTPCRTKGYGTGCIRDVTDTAGSVALRWFWWIAESTYTDSERAAVSQIVGHSLHSLIYRAFCQIYSSYWQMLVYNDSWDRPRMITIPWLYHCTPCQTSTSIWKTRKILFIEQDSTGWIVTLRIKDILWNTMNFSTPFFAFPVSVLEWACFL